MFMPLSKAKEEVKGGFNNTIMENEHVESETYRKQTVLVEPPKEYNFNNFLVELCNGLEKCDPQMFKNEKFRLRDMLSKEHNTWLEMFENLLLDGYIAETNIIYIQRLLANVGVQGLIEKAIEYANRDPERNVLHFFKKEIKLGNGRVEIRIHVKGHECITSKRAKKIVTKVALILCIPEEYMAISGIEAASSLLISVIVPEVYVQILMNLLQDEKKKHYFSPLVKLGVDYFVVSGKEFVLLQKENGDSDTALVHAEKSVLGDANASTASATQDENDANEKTEPIGTKIYSKMLESAQLDLHKNLPELSKKIVKIAENSIAMQKLLTQNQPHTSTLEEINAKALYTKVLRLYPPQPVSGKQE